MIRTDEELARVYCAVEAVLQVQTGAYKVAQHGQYQQVTDTNQKAEPAAQDAA